MAILILSTGVLADEYSECLSRERAAGNDAEYECRWVNPDYRQEGFYDDDDEEGYVQEETSIVIEVQYKELMPLLREFSSLTELNQDSWNEANEWKHYVKGTCTVSEVAKVTFLSEIDNAAYEVDCEMANDDRAVLFFDQEYREAVSKLKVGQVINFKGRLKNMQVPFWTSAYIKIE